MVNCESLETSSRSRTISAAVETSRIERLTRDYLALRPEGAGADRYRPNPGLTDFTRSGWAYNNVKTLNRLGLAINAALGDVRMPVMPDAVVLQNIGFCNLRCPYCPSHGTDESHAANQSKTLTMSDDKIREIAHGSFPYASQISFSGAGENLLARNVAVAAELAHVYGSSMMLNTNGTVLSKKQLRHLWGATHMRISLDAATPTVFEALRLGANYKKVMRNVKVITRTCELLPPSLGLDLAINFGICASNLREMALMVDLAHAVGIKVVYGFEIETTMPNLVDEQCRRYRSAFDFNFRRLQTRAVELGVHVRMVAPQFEMADGEPDLPMGDRLILPPLPESYYDTLPPISELLDFRGVEEEAAEFAIDALEMGLTRMSGPLNQSAGEAKAKADALHAEQLVELNRAYSALSPEEHTRLATLKDSDTAVKHCEYLHRFLYIHADSYVRPCCFQFMPLTGTLADGTAKEIFNGPKIGSIARRLRSDDPDPACAVCPKWSVIPERELFPFDPSIRPLPPLD